MDSASFHIAHDPIEYRTIHPDTGHIPPLITHDGHIHAVGTAHGRTIPVVCSTRPPVFDVSFDRVLPDHIRVYADYAEDVLAAVCGPDYQERLARLYGIQREYNDLDDAEKDKRRLVLLDESDRINAELTYLRSDFAHQARLVAQAIINDAAKKDGSWDELSDREREVLDRAATSIASAPVGIVDEMLFANPNGELFTGNRGVWRANVPLVVNDGDYYPYTTVPTVYFEATLVIEGRKYSDNVSDLNARHIRVDSADNLLEDLDALGAITSTIRPVTPVDALYRDSYDETVRQRYAANLAAFGEH